MCSDVLEGFNFASLAGLRSLQLEKKFNVATLMENFMKIDQLRRLASVIVFSFLTSFLLIKPSMASIGAITKADLTGLWQMTLTGNTGCGPVSMLVNVTLNSAGLGTNAVIKTHGQCGDSTTTAQTFQVLTMASNGSGTANLSCGVGCGWNLVIQVSPDRSTFNIVDVDPVNPGNYIGGMAVHQ